MAKTYSKRSIYRSAYRYHFQNYGSTQYGKGPRYRTGTLALVGLALVAAYRSFVAWVCGSAFEQIFALLVALACLIISARFAYEWSRFARLAKDFAWRAVVSVHSPDEIRPFFAETYPWQIF